eukprot:3683467-Prymnesium_polylepis.2
MRGGRLAARPQPQLVVDSHVGRALVRAAAARICLEALDVKEQMRRQRPQWHERGGGALVGAVAAAALALLCLRVGVEQLLHVERRPRLAETCAQGAGRSARTD